MIIDTIQTIATGGAFLLGITYIIGGLVVNLHLARRGITEYQNLQVKYLVVGIIFLAQAVGIFALASIPAFFLLPTANNQVAQQLINLLSMSASISLLVIWAKHPREKKSMFTSWQFWLLAGAVGSIFPMMIALRQLMAPSFDLYAVLLSLQAVMSGILAFMALIYHYSCYYYGNHSPLRSLDPIGAGIFIPVQLAGDEAGIDLLAELGLPVLKPGVTGTVLLIDETDRHYIVGFKPGAESEELTLKISKDMISAILYTPR
jgi:hypothetical protein